MTHSRKRALCWLLAALMTAALALFVLLCTDVHYAVNDDAGILRAFLGYENGVPAHFQLFIHGLLAWPLYWLSLAFPSLPWFSYAQMALLLLACLVIAKSILQSFVKHERPLWAGAVMAALFLCALCLKYVSQPTFTQTAALLGAAAVAQMLSVEHDRGPWRVVLGMMGALALLLLCYALRDTAVLPALAFCGLAFVVTLVESYVLAKRSVKPMLLSAAIVAVALCAMAGARQLEIAHSDAQDYLELQNANTKLLDYYGLGSVPQEAFDAVGWSPATVELAKEWCFLDEALTTEAFDTLTAYMEARDSRTAGDRLREGVPLLVRTLRLHGADMRCLALALIVGLFAAAAALLAGKPRYLLALLCAPLGAGVMLLYLSAQGRLPLRALLAALLPCAAYLFALLPACLPKRSTALCALLCAACAAYTAWGLKGVIPGLLIDKEAELEVGSVMGDLEEYALSEPESLFIYDKTIVGGDLRVFPSYPDGMPHNITFWGGWSMRSPQNRALFESFGIDIDHVDPAFLLREDVYVASGRVDPPPMLLLNWLREKVNPDIDWQIASEYGSVYFFQFYEP